MNITKLLAIATILLSVAAAGAARAQTLEAEMRQAAGAYERKDMATAARIWSRAARWSVASPRICSGGM